MPDHPTPPLSVTPPTTGLSLLGEVARSVETNPLPTGLSGLGAARRIIDGRVVLLPPLALSATQKSA
jgi:hypothetical protein